MGILRALIGLIFLLAVAFAFSRDKKHIDWKLVGMGLGLQIIFGLLITQVPFVENLFEWVSRGFVKLLSFSNDGAQFLFNGLAGTDFGYIFAFRVLPTVIFFASISTGLYYLGILQIIVKGIAWVMIRTMRLSGSESLSVAGNIFLGQTEAPLLVKPFIAKMTKSELMCLMTGGMATIAGGVLAGYVTFLGGDDPAEQTRFAAYLLSASIMNAPAAIVMSKILIPEREFDKINKELTVSKEESGVNLIDALSRGASQGLKLALNIGAMLLVFIAIIFLLNYILGDLIGNWTGLNDWIKTNTNGQFSDLSLEYLLGQVFRVFAFAAGVDWNETLQVGSLIGEKTVINEFVAYESLNELLKNNVLSNKAIIISTYALCGFSNFSSIAIQIGGIGGIAPNRQGDLSKLGFKALLAATLATLASATIAGAIMT